MSILDGKIVLSGVPVGAPGYYPGPNFKELPCSICGKKCHIGPQQQTVLAQNNEAVVVCFVCVIKTDPTSLPKLIPLTDKSGSTFDADEMKNGEWKS